MPSDAALAAMQRIEQALDRLEAIDPAPPADPALADRHERLRAGVRDVIAGLDRMIAAEGQG